MMKKKKANSINTVSEKFGKYLLCIRIFKTEYFLVWGADISRDASDKILVDKKNYVLLFDNINDLFHLLRDKKRLKIFDNRNFLNWIDELKKITGNGKIIKPYALYDFDLLLRNLLINEKVDYANLTKKILKEFIDCINFIRDFAYQTKDKKLLLLTKERNLRILWNFTYENYVWRNTLNKDDKPTAKLNEKKFKRTLSEVLIIFLYKLKVIR